MAEHAFSVTRRAALTSLAGAASTAPIAGSALAIIPQSAWVPALAKVRALEARYGAYHRAFVVPVSMANAALQGPYRDGRAQPDGPTQAALRKSWDDVERVEQRFGEMVSQYDDALDTLMQIPAPHGAALTFKAEQLARNPDLASRWARAIAADCRRMCSGEEA